MAQLTINDIRPELTQQQRYALNSKLAMTRGQGLPGWLKGAPATPQDLKRWLNLANGEIRNIMNQSRKEAFTGGLNAIKTALNNYLSQNPTPGTTDIPKVLNQNIKWSWKDVVDQLVKPNSSDPKSMGTIYKLGAKEGENQYTLDVWAKWIQNVAEQYGGVYEQAFNAIINKINTDNATVSKQNQDLEQGKAALTTPVDSQVASGTAGKPVNPNDFKSIALRIVAALNGNSDVRGATYSPAQGATLSWSNLFNDSATMAKTGFRPEQQGAITKTFIAGIQRAKNIGVSQDPSLSQKCDAVLNWVQQGNNALRAGDLAKYIDDIVKYSTAGTGMGVTYAKEVQGLERMLANMGETDSKGRPIKVDNGVIGPQIREVLAKYGYSDINAYIADMKNMQQNLGLTPDGIFGKNTQAAMQQAGYQSLWDYKQKQQRAQQIQADKTHMQQLGNSIRALQNKTPIATKTGKDGGLAQNTANLQEAYKSFRNLLERMEYTKNNGSIIL